MAEPRRVRLGLDLGGTKCLGVALVGGEVVARRQVPAPTGPEELARAVSAVVGELAAATGPRPAGPGEGGEPDPVGVGAPGLVDRRGVLTFAPNLGGLSGVGVGALLAAALGRRVVVGNDATCAALGEHRLGAARGLADVVVATLGTGIGGGVVVGGRLLRGAHGFAGEIGHMIVDPDGPPCPCGQRGCWERYASGSGLGRLGREAAQAGLVPRVVALAGGDPEGVRGEHVTGAAAEGDPGARAVLAELARWVALGLVNLANAFDPAAFVLGGGLVAAGDELLVPVGRAFADLRAADDRRPSVPVVAARLGVEAGAIGAALLADEEAEPCG